MCSLHTNKSILISNSYNNLEIWDLIKNQIPNFDLIYLEKQPDYFGLKINFFLDFFVKKESLVSYKAVFDCNWNEYKKTNVKKKILGENKRRIRRLKSLGNLEFIIETNNKTYLDALKIILYQKEQKYIESGYNMFENQQYKFLYLNCKKDLGKLGNTHISTLRINNKIIAGHWGFISKDTLYHVIPSYENAKWAKYSPGTILLEYLMEWACKSGLKKFDFTEGYAKYKSNWANHKVFLYETIYPNTIKGKIYITLKKIKNKYFQWECSKKFNIIKYYMKLSLQKFIKKIKIEH